jgi:hypothetical protein
MSIKLDKVFSYGLLFGITLGITICGYATLSPTTDLAPVEMQQHRGERANGIGTGP